MMHVSLAFIWLGLIGFAIIMYVILDGFDLGIGIMSIFINDEHQRDIMISTILPVWDGNETWLVLGGAALYGAFPLAFATLLPALYIPILIMVCALLFRGVAFEFRLKADTSKFVWEYSFFFGSLLAAFIQGVMLGTFVQGFTFEKGVQTVSAMQWFTPFSLTCGVAVIFGYVLLGSNWLIAKTVGSLQQQAYKFSKITLIVVAVFAVAISAWSPFVDPKLWQRWFHPENVYYLAFLPFFTSIAFTVHLIALIRKQEFSPFYLSVVIFLLCYLGFIISSWPYIVPRSITYVQAAAPQSSLLFMLVGACIMLPVLLYYTFHAYQIFQGKVTEVIGY